MIGYPKLGEALSKLQAKCGGMRKSGNNPHLRSRYSTLDDAMDVIRPHLEELGLAIVQAAKCDGDRAGVVTTVMHSSGEVYQTELMLPWSGKNAVQAIGSAITYARRYSLMSLCGMAGDEHDDDGHLASRCPAKPKQADVRPPGDLKPAPFEGGEPELTPELLGQRAAHLLGLDHLPAEARDVAHRVADWLSEGKLTAAGVERADQRLREIEAEHLGSNSEGA